MPVISGQGISGCASTMASGTCRAASPIIVRSGTTALRVLASAKNWSLVKPATKASISATAAKISWIRSCHGLGDTDGLLVDALAHRWPKAARSAQIDLAAKELFQEQLQPYHSEISCGSVEFHQQVHVARYLGLVSGDRT